MEEEAGARMFKVFQDIVRTWHYFKSIRKPLSRKLYELGNC